MKKQTEAKNAPTIYRGLKPRDIAAIEAWKKLNRRELKSLKGGIQWRRQK